MCIYAPNDPRGRSEFFLDLWRHTLAEIPLLLGGDFDCIDSLELDRVGDKGSIELKEFEYSSSLYDVLGLNFQG